MRKVEEEGYIFKRKAPKKEKWDSYDVYPAYVWSFILADVFFFVCSVSFQLTGALHAVEVAVGGDRHWPCHRGECFGKVVESPTLIIRRQCKIKTLFTNRT